MCALACCKCLSLGFFSLLIFFYSGWLLISLRKRSEPKVRESLIKAKRVCRDDFFCFFKLEQKMFVNTRSLRFPEQTDCPSRTNKKGWHFFLLGILLFSWRRIWGLATLTEDFNVSRCRGFNIMKLTWLPNQATFFVKFLNVHRITKHLNCGFYSNLHCDVTSKLKRLFLSLPFR